MTYLLSGILRAEITDDLLEPLHDVAIRFYNPANGPAGAIGESGAVALGPEHLRSKESRWVGQAQTTGSGEFSIDLARRSVLGAGDAPVYAGGPLEVDVYCRLRSLLPDAAGGGEVQFTIGIFQPDWRGDEDVFTANRSIVVPRTLWSKVRTLLDAWVISGRLTRRQTGEPVAGVRVSAFDADLVRDDPLGSSITDDAGRFRIDFSSTFFRDAGPGAFRLERTGPDVYFHIQAADGTLVYAEEKSRASDPDRRNADALFTTELQVD